jgi:hypothetical protein
MHSLLECVPVARFADVQWQKCLKARAGQLCLVFLAPGLRLKPRPKSGKAKQMTNVIPFQPKGFDDMPDAIEPRRAFSFDMAQSKVGGMVLIDACIPAAMATEFMRLLMSFQDAAGRRLTFVRAKNPPCCKAWRVSLCDERLAYLTTPCGTGDRQFPMSWRQSLRLREMRGGANTPHLQRSLLTV